MQSPFLATALEAANAATVIRRYYQRNLDIQIKADKSPVAWADIETEKVIRGIIGERFPEHGFYGEETGQNALDADYLWLVDPIDGTKAFVREYPFFSTQIALMHRDRLIVGVSSAPVYGELAYAQIGVGAWLNDEPLKVSSIDTGGRRRRSRPAISRRWRADGNGPVTVELVARANRIRGATAIFCAIALLAAGKRRW